MHQQPELSLTAASNRRTPVLSFLTKLTPAAATIQLESCQVAPRSTGAHRQIAVLLRPDAATDTLHDSWHTFTVLPTTVPTDVDGWLVDRKAIMAVLLLVLKRWIPGLSLEVCAVFMAAHFAGDGIGN